MNRRKMLQKAQELATRALEDESQKNDGVPPVPMEYKQGKPQINEPVALCTGLIDRLPKGPKTGETGTSPTRQKQILQQAVRKMDRNKRTGHPQDDLDPLQ